MDKKTLLITGITGFLGKNLIKILSENFKNQFKIIGISKTPSKIIKLKNIIDQNVFDNLTIKCIDIVNDKIDLEKLFIENNIDYVIHAAAIKYIDFDNPIKIIETNINGSLNIVKLSVKYKVKNLIAISTDKANDPINLYGYSKKIMEDIVSHYGYSIYQGVNFFWSDGSVLDIWYNQMKNEKNLKITNFNQSRNYSTISNICYDLINNLDSKNKIIIPSKIFNIKLIDLFNIFVKFFNYDSKKIDIVGDRKNEKMNELLIDNKNYNEDQDVNLIDIIKYTFMNEVIDK